MKIISRTILIISIIALYLERELAFRNLGYWINNSSNSTIENLWLFSKPYLLVLITYVLVIKKTYLSIVPISIGIIGIIITSYKFISIETWQYNNIENYELFTLHDSSEIRILFIICIKIIFYATSFFYYYRVKFRIR